MKQIQYLLALAVIAGGLFMAGCASAHKNVYRTSGVTHAAVRAALIGWNDHLGVAYGRLGTNVVDVAEREALKRQEEKVRDAYRKYQAAQATALTVAQAYLQVQAAPDQDRLAVALAESTRAGSELFGLIAQFVPQLKPTP